MAVEHTPQTALPAAPRAGEAISVRRVFTQAGIHPFETVEWEIRDAKIGHGDKVAFHQPNVEFPSTWSQNSTGAAPVPPSAPSTTM